jgi:Domain of unknown function (DUF5753)
MTADEVAAELHWSGSKISRIELCRTGVKAPDLVKLLNVYSVPAKHRDELIALAREPRRRGWWETFTDVLPAWYAAYLMLESEAERISWWSPELMTGLLQTEGYVRAVMDAEAPEDPPGEVTRRIQARLRRQHILIGENPTDITVVLDESVLMRRLGDRQVMNDQLAHLIEISALPNVSLRVLRLADTHPVSGGGGFALMQFPPVPGIGPASDVVHVEQLGRSGALYIEDDAETHEYRMAFRRLLAESLDEVRSRELIETIRREMWE